LDFPVKAARIMTLDSLDPKNKDPNQEYVQLQLRIFRTTLIVTAFAGITTFVFFDVQDLLSLLFGALLGILYLRLLSRSIGQLGKTSSSVSKIQLLLPVLMVLAVSKLPELHFLPSFIGFMLYKPSLILQFLLEP